MSPPHYCCSVNFRALFIFPQFNNPATLRPPPAQYLKGFFGIFLSLLTTSLKIFFLFFTIFWRPFLQLLFSSFLCPCLASFPRSWGKEFCYSYTYCFYSGLVIYRFVESPLKEATAKEVESDSVIYWLCALITNEPTETTVIPYKQMKLL